MNYLYEAKQKKYESELIFDIIEIFKSNRNYYGTRKLKKELSEKENGCPSQNQMNYETGSLMIISLGSCNVEVSFLFPFSASARSKITSVAVCLCVAHCILFCACLKKRTEFFAMRLSQRSGCI